jgi:hypothetical protein
MKQISVLLILFTILTSCNRTECENADHIAEMDFKNADFKLHSMETLPVENSYFYVLRENFDVKWRFISQDSIGFYKCYDSTMTSLLNRKLGFDFIKKAHSISDSLETLPNWTKDAEFDGGLIKLQRFIRSRLKITKEELNQDVGKKVMLEFDIDENGKVTNPKVRRGINAEIDNKIIGILNQIPNWTPAYQYGKAIKKKYTMPLYIETE